MRLADFIMREMESILVEWESFARTCSPPAKAMSPLALRDHAKLILHAVSKDLGTSQTAEAQVTKSHGEAPVAPDASETAAQSHAVLRASSGFDINALVAEYRALRASVLRLWMAQCDKSVSDFHDMVRFNEAIDQAIAESIEFFDVQIEKARNLLLGMLGHDMRTPLSAIKMTAIYLSQLNAGLEVSEAAALLIRSGATVQVLLDDLVDFNRTRLGVGVNISPATVELGSVFAEELEMLRQAHPDRTLEFEHGDDTTGFWDAHRLQQLLRNLVVNAIKYGSPTSPVRVALTGDSSQLSIAVKNLGPTIDQTTLDGLFEPLKRAPHHERSWTDTSLGLGLFIAREIAKAHRGHIEATSIDGETTFAVRLPRHAEA